MSLDTIVYGNTVSRWLIAVGIALAVWIALIGIRRLVVKRLEKWAVRTHNRWDDLASDLIRRTRGWFLAIVAIVIGARSLALSPAASRDLWRALILAFVVQAGLWGIAATRNLLERYRVQRMANDRGAATMIGALTFIAQVIIWTAVLLVALQNIGVNVTALITTLGVGGIALGLALQQILGDMFASLAIVLDKPFVVGDFIIVGDFMGTVTHIGLKTTRLNSLSGESLVFSNSDLLSSRIRNYALMKERRVVFTLGVTYDTPRTELNRIPGVIKTIIAAQSLTRVDRSHFSKFGASSLDFETVYYVLTPDYNKYMDIQQAIYLAIHEQFEAAGIELAFPTQTLILSRADPGASASPESPPDRSTSPEADTAGPKPTS